MGVTYLDWAATALPLEKSQNTMCAVAADTPGNPSSPHSFGKSAGEALRGYRKKCADLLKCSAENIIFTSGATESNNTVIQSLLLKKKSGRIITTQFEHPSVSEPLQRLREAGWGITYLQPDRLGRIRPESLQQAIDDTTDLVTILTVQNEIGSIQPIKQLSRVVRVEEKKRKKMIHLHTDCVQALGKIIFPLQQWDVDSASLSSHKIGGPRGVGLLYVKNKIPPLHTGGGQERGLRAGTENTPGIAGFTEALSYCNNHFSEHLKEAEEKMEYMLTSLSKMSGVMIIPSDRQKHTSSFSPWILSMAVPPVPGEVIVRVLGDSGYAISTGAACSSAKKHVSPAAGALRLARDTSNSLIRVSIGPTTTTQEIHGFIETLSEELPILRKVASNE
jgi:cysteine desulfurase